MSKQSIEIVKTQYCKIENAGSEIVLESGRQLEEIIVAYETYGTLNENKDNVVLIVHALSANAHAGGLHSSRDKKPGWWDEMIGKGKALDTEKFFVVCSNVLGGCSGTTGPNSIDPKTNKEYGIDFPVITISDMVKVQKKFLSQQFGISRLYNVIGGSMGGMQALEWVTQYSEDVDSAVVIAATAKLSAQSIAFNVVGRNAIKSDPNWNNGNYYDKDKKPDNGLAIARMIGHITYLSDESMRKKFGRKLQTRESYGYDFNEEFQVESYLRYQGTAFVERFDANSYLYITKAMDYFDLVSKYGSLIGAMKNVKAKMLIISFDSDWLFPTYQSKEIVSALMNLNKQVSFCEINTKCGHDAFLLEYDQLTKLVSGFLKNVE